MSALWYFAYARLPSGRVETLVTDVDKDATAFRTYAEMLGVVAFIETHPRKEVAEGAKRRLLAADEGAHRPKARAD